MSESGRKGYTYPFFARPDVGSFLTVLAAACFLVQLMILPLVGPCGSRAPHALCNLIGFLGMLCVTGGVAVAATVSKLRRRKIDGSPLPAFSIALCVGCLLILICTLTGLFSI
ncbi:MAG: hypothetical protein DRP22_03350 [Verrucomicrobia bacterium]|nr:MAG: hypothetical protein DRP22_03350 [Verrucomicrobiota bacterium]